MQARTVDVQFSEYGPNDEITARFGITRRPPRGWFYWVSLWIEDTSVADARASGCALSDGSRGEYRRKRSFFFTFSPKRASFPERGLGEWSLGPAFVLLYLQRDGAVRRPPL